MAGKAKGPPTFDQLVDTLTWAVARIAYHSDGCKGGTFATCRCSNAVTVRRLEVLIKRARPKYETELEMQARFEARQIERDARRIASAAEHRSWLFPGTESGASEEPKKDT